MDSIKTKITSAPQMSGYKTVTFASAAATGTTHSNVDYCNIPWGARVSSVKAVVQVAWNNVTSAYLHAGYPAGTAQTGGGSVSADVDAYLAGNNPLQTINTYITSEASVTKAAGIMDEPPYSTSSTYGVESDEKVVPVTLEIVTAGGSAATAGQFIWWVEYVFPPNIVWTQADLA